MRSCSGCALVAVGLILGVLLLIVLLNVGQGGVSDSIRAPAWL